MSIEQRWDLLVNERETCKSEQRGLRCFAAFGLQRRTSGRTRATLSHFRDSEGTGGQGDRAAGWSIRIRPGKISCFDTDGRNRE